MKLSTVVVLLCLVAGCSKKDNAPPKDNVASGASTAAAGSSEPPPAQKPADNKLDCDKVFPQALRDKFFAGAKFTNNPAPLATIGECKVDSADGKLLANITVTCHDGIAGAGKQPTIDSLKKMKATEVAGVGSPALSRKDDTGKSVTAWDTDSKCQTIVFLFEAATADPVEITKELLAFLPVK